MASAPYITANDLKPLGALVVRRVKARAKKGLGAGSKPLKPKKDGSKSTLKDTGAMLNSLGFEIKEDFEVEINVGTDYAKYVNEDRPFMGFGRGDEGAIEKALAKILKKAEDRWNRSNR